MAKLADLERIQRLWARIKSKFVAKDSGGNVSVSGDLYVDGDSEINGALKVTDTSQFETIDVVNGSDIIFYSDDNKSSIVLGRNQGCTKLTAGGNALATETFVNNAVANAGHLKREKVSTLPGVSTASENVIYMVPATDGSGDDVLDEYMKIDGKMEKIGSNRVDLSGYSTTEQMKSEISTAVSNSYTLITDAEIDALT